MFGFSSQNFLYLFSILKSADINIKVSLDFAKHSSHIEGNVDLINGKDINRNCWFGCLAFIAADGSTNYAYEQTKKKYDIIFTPHKQEKYMMFYEAGDMHDDWFVYFYDIVPDDVKKDVDKQLTKLGL